MITDESQIIKICALITPHVPAEICTTAEGVAWLVGRHQLAQKALTELESIRTEKLAAKNLGWEASLVSLARTFLR